MYQSDYPVPLLPRRLFSRLEDILGKTDSLSTLWRGGMRRPAVLAGSLCAGFCIGLILFVRFRDAAAPLMRQGCAGPVSIVGLWLSSLLPFFLVSLTHRLIYAVCFCKSCLFCFCACTVGYGFGSGGWLVQGLVFLPDLLILPALFWYCLGLLHGDGASRVWIWVGYVTVVVMGYGWLVAPMAVRLL